MHMKNNWCQTMTLQSLFKSLLISIITFCVTSYVSLMYSLLFSAGNLNMKPVVNIGFPFKYYHQFWLNKNDFPNNSWNLSNFFLNILLCWILTSFIYFYFNKPRQ
ncbi:hypothetical protein BTO06_00725 [Tenacibaculum sp. SZ-18]|nr:hypothetical protein BTO06_00725 [Tenacibaculum sp. SZ-18]